MHFPKLHIPIKTIEQGNAFIQALIDNNLMFHLDDDVKGIIWDASLSIEVINLIETRHQELWTIGNPWKYADSIITKFLER